MNAIAEIGRNSVSKNRFSLSIENEQADAGRVGRTCPARPNFQARTGTWICLFLLECGSFVRGRIKKKVDSRPFFILSRRRSKKHTGEAS